VVVVMVAGIHGRAVGALQVARGERLRGRSAGHHLAVEKDRRVEETGGFREGVMGDEQELAPGGQGAERPGKVGGAATVESGEGFVEQVEVGFLGPRPREEGPLLLASGEFLDLAARQFLQSEEGESPVDGLVVLFEKGRRRPTW